MGSPKHYFTKFSKQYVNDTPVILISRATDQKRGKYERLFWTIYTLIMLSLTAYDLIALCQRFVSQTTSSSAKMMRNGSMEYSNACICSFLYPPALRYGLNVSDSKQVNEFLQQWSNESDILSFLAQELPENRSQSIVLPRQDPEIALIRLLADRLARAASANGSLPNSQRHDTLVYLTVGMLLTIVRTESMIRPPKTLDNYRSWGLLEWDTETQAYGIMPGTEESFRHVYKFYLSKKVNFGALYRMTAAAFCHKMGFYLYSRVQNSKTLNAKFKFSSVCDPERLYWLGSNALEEKTSQPILCMHLPDDVIKFKREGDYTEMGFHHNIYDEEPSWLESYVELSEQGDDANDFYIPFGQDTTVHAFVQGHYRSISTRRLPCSQTPKTMCRYKCRTDFIVKHCRCFPMSMTTQFERPEGLAICGQADPEIVDEFGYSLPLANSSKCRRIWEHFDPSEGCASKCFDSCETVIMGFDYVSTTKHELLPLLRHHQRVSTLRIFADKFIYPFIQEHLSMDERSFTASIGGVTSLWLGISLIAVVHFVIFCLKIPFEYWDSHWRSAKKDHNETKDENANVPTAVSNLNSIWIWNQLAAQSERQHYQHHDLEAAAQEHLA